MPSASAPRRDTVYNGEQAKRTSTKGRTIGRQPLSSGNT